MAFAPFFLPSGTEKAETASTTTGIYSSTLLPKYSVDRVVNQVEAVGGKVNDLVVNAQKQGDLIVQRGEETAQFASEQFALLRKTIDMALVKVQDRLGSFPVVMAAICLAAAVICVLLVVVYGLIRGSEFFVKRYSRLEQNKNSWHQEN
ncbi:hypothetical protein AB6A40_009734 [Gnathostoma spinigerum]|uniref:V-SNARE coiled-coil homology domain-containing protein n=1 Tax=Gnathostoma spinigerum TaxID=75299 RepID=A0ABD6F225_9BILA